LQLQELDFALFAGKPSSYHGRLSMSTPKTMRATLPAALLITTLLAACATDKDVLTAKDIPQSGTLKVHPGLIKSPPSAQAQPPAPAAEAATPGATGAAGEQTAERQ
jgi:hypothetical protein